MTFTRNKNYFYAHYKLHGTVLVQNNETKDLGVTFASLLSFRQHIRKMVKVSINTLITPYNALFRSWLQYTTVVAFFQPILIWWEGTEAFSKVWNAYDANIAYNILLERFRFTRLASRCKTIYLMYLYTLIMIFTNPAIYKNRYCVKNIKTMIYLMCPKVIRWHTARCCYIKWWPYITTWLVALTVS